MAKPKGLTEKTVHKIRAIYAKGQITQQLLAKKFGVSQSTICKIVNNYIHKSDTNVVMGGAADVKYRVEYKYGDQRQRRKRLQAKRP